MKQKHIVLSRRYVTVLQKYLKEEGRGNLKTALELGRDAVALGLETLELARIHESALIALELTGVKRGLIRRAEAFFTEAITPIVETHRAARHDASPRSA